MATVRKSKSAADSIEYAAPSIPDPELVARRREVFDEVMRLREEIGPVHGLTVAELLERDEADE